MRRILVEQIRIQPGSLNPRATDKKERQKGGKISIFSSLEDDKDSAATLTTSSAALSLEQWLGCLGRAEMGRTKETEKVQPTTSSMGCLSVTFQLWLEAVCWRHLMCVCTSMSVYVHRFGTSRFLSLTVWYGYRDTKTCQKVFRMGAGARLT